MNEKALERARRGAAWLDKKLGPGWRRKIKRRKLDMSGGGFSSGGCGCIMAQLDKAYGRRARGTYGDGVRNLLGISPWGRRIVALGLDVPLPRNDYDYDELTQAWRQVLREGVPS